MPNPNVDPVVTVTPGAPKPEFGIEIEVAPAFHDLDPMNIVWHGHYVKYIELARCALLAKYDYDYPAMHASGYVWPIVDLRLKYVRPAAYAQRLRVSARIVEWEYRLRMEYEIRDIASGERLTKASTIQVAIDVATREMLYQCPPVLWERLGVQP